MINFPDLNSMSGADFLIRLKRFAKLAKKADTTGKTLTWHQDQVAISLGFRCWSLFHQHFSTTTQREANTILVRALECAELGTFLDRHRVRSIEKGEEFDATTR